MYTTETTWAELVWSLLSYILFNPFIWIGGIVVILAVRDSRKKKLARLQSANQSTTPITAVSVAQPSEPDPIKLLEDMARTATSPAEKDVLARVIHSVHFGLHYLITPAAYKRAQGAAPVTQSAPTTPVTPGVVTNPLPVPTPSVAQAVTPAEPLAERGLKALQNINILLYLGAFFVVIAAGIFVGSTYQAIGAMGQVAVMVAISLAFYGSGLGLYALTRRMKPAGVTFTAIGLLLVPLIGVAVQSLLFSGQSPATVWLITSLIAIIMQVIAFLLIRKTYIVYFATLTTISLFQSIVASNQAHIYWYGWVLLLVAMVYSVIANFVHDDQVSVPLEATAHIFVPLSLVIMMINYQLIGSWQVGVQLGLGAIFYFVSALLRNFDDSQETRIYLWLACSLWPVALAIIGINLHLLPLTTFSAISLSSLAYILAEKKAVYESQRQIYQWVSDITMLLAPLLLWSSGISLAWTALIAAGFHAGHFLTTRRGSSYVCLLITLSTLPLAFGLKAFTPILPYEYIGLAYLGLGAITAVIGQHLWQAKRPTYAETGQVFVSLWIISSIAATFTLSTTVWPAILALFGGGIFLFYSLTGQAIFLIPAALAWNIAIITLGLRQHWSGTTIAGGISATAVLIYGLNFLPRIQLERVTILSLVVFNLAVGYIWGWVVGGVPGTSIMLMTGLITIAISLHKEDGLCLGLGSAGLYGGVILLSHALHLNATWVSIFVIISSAIIYTGQRLRPKLSQAKPVMAIFYGAGLFYAFINSFQSTSWANLMVILVIAGLLLLLSYLEDERIGSAAAFLVFLGASFQLAGIMLWQVSPILFLSGLLLYGAGSLLPDSDRAKLARWVGLLGSYLTLTTNTSALPTWLPIMQNYTAGGLSLAESYRLHNRIGKYASSVVIWLVTLQAFYVTNLTNPQFYAQTTAVYFAALAYLRHRHHQKEPRDVLVACALGFATIPLAIQAINDITGGYVLGVLGLGIAILILGLATHYPLVRTWGIVTLVIITLYKTAGAILNLPVWIWFAVIGVSILAGAIYLLSKRKE